MSRRRLQVLRHRERRAAVAALGHAGLVDQQTRNEAVSDEPRVKPALSDTWNWYVRVPAPLDVDVLHGQRWPQRRRAARR